MRLLAAAVAVSLLATSIAPSTSARLFSDPYGKAKAIVSPDGQHALWGDYRQSRLWIEDIGTHTDRPVDWFTVQTISLAWSQDSRYFVVNDRPTSSESDAYLFDTNTLHRTKLRDKLTAAMPQARQYYLLSAEHSPRRGTVSHGREVLHSYLDVRRWFDDEHVELQLHGTYSGRFRHDDPEGHLYPAGCFDLRLRMGLDGSVEKLSERTTETRSSDPSCGWGRDD